MLTIAPGIHVNRSATKSAIYNQNNPFRGLNDGGNLLLPGVGFSVVFSLSFSSKIVLFINYNIKMPQEFNNV